VIGMLLLAALQVTPAYALSYTSTAAGGNWNSSTTWVPNGIPGALDNVTIASGATVTVTADATAAALTFASGASSSTVAVDPGITLTITGAITIQRAGASATDTLAVGAGNVNAGSLRFTAGGAGGHLVTISTGMAAVSGNIVGLTGSPITPTITFTAAGTLKVGGTMYAPTNGNLNTVPGSTVEYNGSGPQNVPQFAYSNLALSGSGAKTLLSGVGISGNLTLAGTAIASSSYSKNIGGNLVVGAGSEFDMGATLTVTGTTTVGGTLKLYNTANKTFMSNVGINSGGVWSEAAAAAYTFGGSLQNDGSLTASTGLHTFAGTGTTIGGANPVAIPNLKVNGTLTNTGTLTVSTGLTGAGGLTNAAGAVLNFGGPIINPTLTASAAGNSVHYTGGAQTVYATAYDILVLRGAGVKSVLAGTTVATNLSIAPAGTASASIAAGQTIPVGTLLLAGVNQVPGTYGGTGSGATHINTTYFAATTGKVNVAGKSVNVTADAKSKFYGDPDPAFTYTSSNPAVTFTGSLSRVSGEHVGNYAITIGTLSAGFYAINFTSANLTIGKKALTAGTVNDQYIAPGAPDPVFTVSYAGLVGSDTFASIDTKPTCSVSVPHTDPGDYPIQCTDGSGFDNDYDLSGVHYSTTALLHVTDAEFSPNPSSWNFGLVKVGTASAGRDFYINNTGTSSMVINTLALGGANPGQFHIMNSGSPNHCFAGSTLGASSFCIVTVVFKPTFAGTKSGLIVFTDTAAGSPHAIPLSGRGMAEVAINGGFNLYPNVTAKIPSGWAASKFGAADGKYTLIKQEGAASIKISNTAAVAKTLMETRALSGAKGSYFTLSLWVKGQAIPTTGPAVQAVVTLYNGSTVVKKSVLVLPNGTYGFVPRKLSFVAPGAYNKVAIQLIYGKGSGAVWFDGLSLLRAP
jgi:hypothetical protein